MSDNFLSGARINMNGTLAVMILLLTGALFAAIILMGIGGQEALFLIIGYLAAWSQMVVVYYFRKKPTEKESNGGG